MVKKSTAFFLIDASCREYSTVRVMSGGMMESDEGGASNVNRGGGKEGSSGGGSEEGKRISLSNFIFD